MSMVRLFLSSSILFLTGAAAWGDGVSGQAFSRQGELLTSLEGTGGSSFDEVRFHLGKKAVSGSEVGVKPEGWDCFAEGAAWRCDGPMTRLSYFSFRPRGRVRFSNRIDIEASLAGRRVYRQKLDVETLGAPQVKTSLEGILDTPSRVTPGSYLVATPRGNAYRSGRWRLNVGGSAQETEATPVLSREEIERLPVGQRSFAPYLHLVPGIANPDTGLSFTYTDPWGARLVDAPIIDFLWDDPAPEECEPSLSGCQERAAVGASLCLCGCFPSWTSFSSLQMDGRQIAAPSASSVSMMSIPLTDVEPGKHQITWGAGSGGSGSLEFEAIRVGGSINQDLLRVGQSTGLRFQIEGTEERLKMNIKKAAGRISIQGGNDQIAYTRGGANNDIERILYAEGVGDFNVDFSIDLPPCPCGGSNLLHVDERIPHSVSLEGESNLTWPGSGLRFPIRFATDNLIGLTPPPPYGEDSLEVELAQLDLKVTPGNFDQFTFQTRADRPSINRFSKIEVNDQGHFRSGDVDSTLYTDFSVGYDKLLPLKVGVRYELDLDGWSFSGQAPDLGAVDFSERIGTTSSAVFHDIKKDAAGTLLYGYADFSLRGHLSVGGRAPTRLSEAISRGQVDIGFMGSGLSMGNIFTLDVTRRVGSPFALAIPYGTVFEPGNSAFSTMIVGESIIADLTAATTQVTVRGYSLDRGRRPPPQESANDPGWSVIDEPDNPRYQSARNVITAGRELAGGGLFSSGTAWIDRIIQSSIWLTEDPDGYHKEDLEEDLTTQAEEEGEPQSEEEISQLTEQIWADIDLTVKQGRGG